MGFVNKSIEYKNENFWGVNPQLCFMKPFSLLYNRDTSEDKELSSKDMWVIYFLSHPDEDENKFYRIPNKLEMLQETYHNIDMEDALVKKCIEEYPEVCLNSVERALKAEKEQLLKRAKFLSLADYNYETMTALDNANAKTSKIYDNFEAIENKFLMHKESSRVKGGRKESASEKGEI